MDEKINEFNKSKFCNFSLIFKISKINFQNLEIYLKFAWILKNHRIH